MDTVMIEGTVHGRTDAVVPLTVRGPEGQEEHLDFKLDTGFDGDLSLHSAVVAALGCRASVHSMLAWRMAA